jgi:hypothetical protein
MHTPKCNSACQNAPKAQSQTLYMMTISRGMGFLYLKVVEHYIHYTQVGFAASLKVSTIVHWNFFSLIVFHRSF